jgi:oxygen-dependent protoporphyrinogen oxidase
MSDIPSLSSEAARAATLRVVVVGGGMSGLVAALHCAKVGLAVTVVEATDRLGGVVRSAEVDGITLDVGAESFATRGGHVRALVDELGLSDAVVTPAGRRAWVAGLPGDSAAPLPAGGILGIPANPFVDDVRRIIGWRGAWRAYTDRWRPVLTIGQEHSLGRLVRARLGDRVVDRLVAPVTSGVYSSHPDDIDVDHAAPGLNAALTRAGSLLSAVALVQEQSRAGKAPGAAVEGIDGGMSRLVAALRERLASLGVEFILGTRVERLDPRADGGWSVELAPALDAEPGAEPEPPLAADAVIVATHEPEARRLLAPVVPGLAAASAAAAPVVEIVTLVLDLPTLDAAPRGSGVLTVPGSHVAKALTHSTAKWSWVARDAGARHVVRVSFGSQGEAPATAELTDEDAVALAVAEASALLGVPFGQEALIAGDRARYVQAQPGSAIGQADAAAAARAAITSVPGVGAVGAWLAGTGLAQVVPDAAAESDRVRAALLWGRH